MKEKKAKQPQDPKVLPCNRIILPLLFIFFSFFLEMINFLYLGFRDSAGRLMAFPSACMFNLGAVLVIAGLIYIVKNKKAMISIFFVFITLQLIVNILNANIYAVFGDIFSMDYLKLGDEAFAAIRLEFIDFGSICLYLAIFAVIITSVVLLYKFNKKTIRLKKLSTLSFSLILVLVMEACGATLYSCEFASVTNASAESDVIENNTSYLYDSFQFKNDAYKTFGYYGFYLKNIWSAIFGRAAAKASEVEELNAYIEDGKTTLDQLDGRLADDNLIVILCESHEWFGYDPFNTPNVWRLMNGQGCAFTNFYGHNKTNVSEGIVMAGNKAQQSDLSALVKKFGYDYAYTLPKLFKEAHSGEDVVTNYFHTWQRTFYDRDDTYLQDGFGFDNFYSIDDYSKNDCKFFGDWVNDSDFVEEFKDQFVPENKKFLSFFATMTTHGAYTYENPRFEASYAKFDANLQQYKEWLENFTDEAVIPTSKGDFEQFRRYKVGMIEFDNMIGKIFELLQERNVLDNTTLVLFSDHNAYYDNLSYKVKCVDKTDYSNIKAHHIPLIIYNSKLTPGNYNQFCNTFDVFPTIAELHGLLYNKNLVQGYNLFSEDIKNSFFASQLGGMFNEQFFSKNISEVVSFEENFSLDDLAIFKAQAENFYQKQKKLERIYTNNLAK